MIKMMIVRHKTPYMKPKKSVGVPILAHSGELVLPVETTSQLNNYLLSKNKEMPSRLRMKLKDLITTVPQFKK